MRSASSPSRCSRKRRPWETGATPIATLRCLERDPARRFARAADFVTAIEDRVVPPPPDEKRRWFGRGERKTGGR
jgi:hypothetical protein